MLDDNRRPLYFSDLSLLFTAKQTSVNRIRVWPLKVLTLVFGVLLLARLAQLTVVEGSWRRRLADENRILTLPIMAQRGILTDRSGYPLTQNVPAYRRQVPGTNPAQLQFESVSREQALQFLVDPKERVDYVVERTYPSGSVSASLVGYVGEVTADELDTHPDYRLGELIGKTGAEQAFERRLRGVPGEEYLEINAQGKAVRTIGIKEAQSGSNIQLSMDLGLQQTLIDAFQGLHGAAVALSPQTGEVLALVSLPAYDPARLHEALSQPGQPFFNRAVGGTYAPGSTFKILTSVAALEEGKVTGDTQFQDTGEIVIGDYRFGNWLYDEHGRTEGQVGLVRALSRSNDIYFYHVGELVGPNKLAEWAGLFGLGKTWGLSSWGEAAGLLPTPEWKQAKRGERWYLGDTYHMAIGQGDVLATPLQIAVMTAGIATGGVVCPPHMILNDPSMVCQQINIDEQTVALVQQGMLEACQPGGTGSPFFTFEPKVACKTGTAQQGGEKALPHAWFTVYAPAENPTIALTVIVEQGGQGSTVAGPIAKKAIEYWLKK